MHQTFSKFDSRNFLKMNFNYSTSRSSWSPNPENVEFQQIKGITVLLGFLIVSIALIILKYMKSNAEKILKASESGEDMLTEITRLREKVEMLLHAPRQSTSSSPPDYVNIHRFDTRLSSHSKSEDKCLHDVTDHGK